MSSVRGKVVAVSGGGTGIGAAVARRYAADGASVVVLGRRPGPIEEVAAEIGGTACVADVTDRAACERAVGTIVERLGGLDVVVANAGGGGYSSVLDTDDDEWAHALANNVTSAFALCRAALPALLSSRGQIVVVSSLAGLFAGPDVAGYTVGKHALVGLTRSLARDFGARGVRANVVCPGWVRTPMGDEEMDQLAVAAGLPSREAAYEQVTAEVPLRRAAGPEEIASIVRFLGSDDSSYVTGAVIVADGGAHAVDLPTLSFERAGL